MDPLLFALFWVFGWAALLVVVWHLRASRRERRMMLIHKERMLAMEKGSPLPELPEYVEPRSMVAEAVAAVHLNPRWPLGLGVISILLGAGISTALAFSGEPNHNQLSSFGLIGIFLGVGLILHYFVTRPGTK
jgi:drug/metabolite transporter (DMT)-like permease